MEYMQARERHERVLEKGEAGRCLDRLALPDWIAVENEVDVKTSPLGEILHQLHVLRADEYWILERSVQGMLVDWLHEYMDTVAAGRDIPTRDLKLAWM